MKKLNFLVLLVWLVCFNCYAQDTIVMKNGMSFQVRIIEENSKELKYRPFEKAEGEPIIIAKSNLKDFSYESGTRPEKKNNTIIVETTDDYSIALRKLVNILSDLGYGIQNIDKEFGTIVTTSKGFKNGTVMLSLQVREGTKTTITIRGTLDGTDLTIYGVTADGKANIEFRGMKGSPMMNSWEEMEKVARTYSEAKVSYSTN